MAAHNAGQKVVFLNLNEISRASGRNNSNKNTLIDKIFARKVMKVYLSKDIYIKIPCNHM